MSTLSDDGSGRQLTYAEALREALYDELKEDPAVILMGEDIGSYGGAYRVTKGFLEEFGPQRVCDTPISEIAIVGAAIGAALGGLRPVAEIMYMDFLTISVEQLVVEAAKMHFMSGGNLRVPMVVRTQYSLGRAHGAQHSQFFPSWFLQVPGLKVVLPSTPHDAKGLLKSAIHDENPVLFIECNLLYRSKGLVPREGYALPLGKSEVKRKGNDITIVAISRLVPEALEAATRLSSEGIDVEVIDPQTIQPLDMVPIIESIEKTGRLVIASDDSKSGGLGAAISSKVMDDGFDFLDAPIINLASPDLPIPFSPVLEKAYMVSQDNIVSAARQLV